MEGPGSNAPALRLLAHLHPIECQVISPKFVFGTLHTHR
jgi:hypothetical protein